MHMIESWELYFRNEDYSTFNEHVRIIGNIISSLSGSINAEEAEKITETSIYYLSYEKAIELIHSNKKDISIGNTNINIDSVSLRCIGSAVSEILHKEGYPIQKIKVRINSFDQQNGKISPENIDNFVFLRGTVCRIGARRPLVSRLLFECNKCREIITLEDNVYKQPKSCKNCGCKAISFIYESEKHEVRDIQEIKIQEISEIIPESVNLPKLVDCILYDDLVGQLIPGDVVEIVGLVQARQEEIEKFKLFVEVNNLNLLKNKIDHYKSNHLEGDYQIFKKISKIENIVGTFIHSLYPKIFGNEVVLSALVMSLFGGTKKYAGESEIRSEIHTLIIGDPGLGKSKMLVASAKILPKSTYVCGNLCTSAGLTISMSHDQLSGNYIVDAGAMVISDNGICCIDEFDKIENPSSLLEAMEEQSVSVAKGGVICSVPTRTTIIAASNPKFGHYEKKMGISDNLTFDQQLLSRFDLIFVLTDENNGEYNKTRKNSDTLLNFIRTDEFTQALIKTEETELINPEILRKYILYARTYINPVLSSNAKKKLDDFYTLLEKENGTSRDLEGLMRLTESRAKIELRSIATEKDAQFAIDLFKKTLSKETVKPKQKSNPLVQIKNLLTQNKDMEMSTEELTEMIESVETKQPTDRIIEKLNDEGVLLKKGRNKYKICM